MLKSEYIDLVGVISLLLLESNPVPSSFDIGVTRIGFVNTNITEQISPELQNLLSIEENGSREIMAKIWYPAKPNPNEDTRFHYGYHTMQNDYAFAPDDIETLEFLRDNAQPSQSYQDAPAIKNKSFPVIFYSHGYGSNVEENEPYFESLVRNGYIVVSVGHTQESSLVTLSSGNIVGQNSLLEENLVRTLPEDQQNVDLILSEQEARDLATIPLGDEVPAELLVKYHYTNADLFASGQHHLNLWVTDTAFVMNQLQALNQAVGNHPLKGIFDLTKTAAIGHSFGGAVSMRFCNMQPSCKASINLDGQSLAFQDEKIQNPHLYLTSDIEATVAASIREGNEIGNIETAIEKTFIEILTSYHSFIGAALDDIYIVTPETISHEDFILSWITLHDFGLGKTLWHPAIESLSLSFLDTYLKEKSASQTNKNLCDLIENSDVLIDEFNNACR